MQQVKFKSIDEFIEFLPDDERKITVFLMNLVESNMVNFTRKLSYNVPFYSKNKAICFIWPASVLWGKKKTYEGVRFGFNQGYLIPDELNYLERGGRKQVYWKDFKSIGEIDEATLKAYLFEALEIDKLSK
ncbi:MAG: DUF1801 domain-containing protein [Flavobacteriales bacterium]|nr:DUF1801 domain-containing protein [Flavobacteriales bacterium]